MFKKGDYVERKKRKMIGYISDISGSKKTAYVKWNDGTSETISTDGLKAFDTTGLIYQVLDYDDTLLYLGHDLEIAQHFSENDFDTKVTRWLNNIEFLKGLRGIAHDGGGLHKKLQFVV